MPKIPGGQTSRKMWLYEDCDSEPGDTGTNVFSTTKKTAALYSMVVKNVPAILNAFFTAQN